MNRSLARVPGSFRDPKGHVFAFGNEIYRTVTESGVPGYERARDCGLLASFEDRGLLVPVREVDRSSEVAVALNTDYVLQHPRLPFISYPYEWSFAALKDAALLQLDVMKDCLDHGIQLSDASAYNIQFNGWRPQFIDVLSFQPYEEGEPWYGYRQFSEQFLNPLLLSALFGIHHNDWYRGRLEGIPSADLSSMLRFRHRLNWKILAHVVLQAKLQRKSQGDPSGAGSRARETRISRNGLRAIVSQLRDWIDSLEPAGIGRTVWSDYATENTYEESEYSQKKSAIAEFCDARKPAMLWDIGCNSGDFSAAALQSGAKFVVGFDADHQALEKAYARAKAKRLAFVPLYQDLANPSPSQGWGESERPGIQERGQADALLALAIIHHLAIGRNVPLPDAIRWLVSLAPDGAIEFVPKNDPTVQMMLLVRDDVFEDYSEEAFATALGQAAKIVDIRPISSTGRKLYIYSR